MKKILYSFIAMGILMGSVETQASIIESEFVFIIPWKIIQNYTNCLKRKLQKTH